MPDTVPSDVQKAAPGESNWSAEELSQTKENAGTDTEASFGRLPRDNARSLERKSGLPGSSHALELQKINAQSPIYLLAIHCLKGFGELINILQTEETEDPTFDVGSTQTAIEEAKARFNGWGTNLAAFRNGTFRTSLDFRVAEAPKIKEMILQILRDLQEYLNDAKLVINGEKRNERWDLDDLSDLSEYSDEESNESIQKDPPSGDLDNDQVSSDLDDVLKAIKASNASLMKLSIIIRSSATRDDYVKAASRFKEWNPEFDVGHVREKYGSAKYSSNWLIQRLGKAITRRRQFLRYRIEHNERLVGMANDDEEMRHKPEKTLASTKATTFVGINTLQNIRRAGSDGGKSFGSGTSYEATVYGGDNTPTTLTVPSPPSFAFPDIMFEYGEPFQCPYCFTEQSVENKSAWKKHVFRDLKPYVCTFRSCEILMFPSRNEWFSHELQYHRREWVCQFCQHPPFETTSAISRHIESIHSAIFSVSSLKSLIQQSEEPVDKILASACPLCDDWEADLERKRGALDSILLSSDESKNQKIFGKTKLFRRHLGRHMEQLALFALPTKGTVESEDDGTDEESEVLEHIPTSEQKEEERINMEVAHNKIKTGLKIAAEAMGMAGLVALAEKEKEHAANALTPVKETEPVVDTTKASEFGGSIKESTSKMISESTEEEEEDGGRFHRFRSSGSHPTSPSGSAVIINNLVHNYYGDDEEIEYRVRPPEDLQKSGMDEQQTTNVLKKDQAIDSNPPVYTRMSRRHLSIETLNRYNIGYKIDEDPDYLLINRWVPEYEQDQLWNHTKELREGRSGGQGSANDTVQQDDIQFVLKNPRMTSPSPLLTMQSLRDVDKEFSDDSVPNKLDTFAHQQHHS